MPKFITENDITNRKIRWQTYAGGIVSTILLIFTILKFFGIEVSVSEAEVSGYVLAGIAAAAFVWTFVIWAIGYFTRPGEGDGIKEVKK